MKSLSVLTIVVFLGILAVPALLPAEEFRVWGGKTDDFTDSKGRVWHGAQQENQSWVDGLKNFPALLKSKP